jgi:hypothetical protein
LYSIDSELLIINLVINHSLSQIIHLGVTHVVLSCFQEISAVNNHHFVAMVKVLVHINVLLLFLAELFDFCHAVFQVILPLLLLDELTLYLLALLRKYSTLDTSSVGGKC